MIKLQRGVLPKYLTSKRVSELTQQYIDSGKVVWNRKQIKTPLLESSNDKCAYCESDLTKPVAFMEVEHFFPKSLYPKLVVDWDNLLPSCKRCNGLKGNYDVCSNPIINPYNCDPAKELTFDTFCIIGITKKGINTVNLLDLNGDDLLIKRSSIGTYFIRELIKIRAQTENAENIDLEVRNEIRAILLAAQRNRPYSASISTIIHSSKDYNQINQKLVSNDCWGEDLEDLHQKSLLNRLPLR